MTKTTALDTTLTDRQVAHSPREGLNVIGSERISFANNDGTNIGTAYSGQVIQCFKVAAGTTVDKVRIRVITAQGGTLTCTVGDGTAANGWDASVDLNASANTIVGSDEDTDTYGFGKYYAVEDTIDVTLSADSATYAVAVFDIEVWYHTARTA